MSRFGLLFAVICFICLSLTGKAQNVSVTDYQVPISSARALWLTGFWNWAQTGDSVTSNRAAVAAKLRWFYSSLPFAWFIDFDGSGGKEFGEWTHSALLRASIRKYILADYDWFGYGQLNLHHQKGYERIASDVTAGTGYGRFIDATALAKAVRIEEQLLKEELLTDHLPKETMIRIANIIEREAEYRDKYKEVYEVYWLKDIEQELEKSGKLKEQKLSAIGVFRIRQVLFGLNQIVNPRYFGWDLSLGVNVVITTPDTTAPGAPRFALSGRFSYPIGWRMQINTLGELYTPMDSSFFKNFAARLSFDYIYELSNRINFILGYTLDADAAAASVVSHFIDASFLYYVESNLSIGIGASTKLTTDQPNRYTFNINLLYNLN